jgi:hypothetical protein
MPEEMVDGMRTPQACAAPLSWAAVIGYELIDLLDFGSHGDGTTTTNSVFFRCHHR